MTSQAPIACLRPLEVRDGTKNESRWFLKPVWQPQKKAQVGMMHSWQERSNFEPAVLLKLDLRGQGLD